MFFVNVKKSLVLFYTVFGFCCASNYMKVKDPFIQTCHIKDPEFVACSTESIQKLFKQLVEGIEGFDAIKTIDPMNLSKIKILQGEGAVSINSTLTKGVATGFANVKVVESLVSPVDYRWKTTLRMPKLRIEGNYHMQGRILVIPMNGHGKCWFECHDINIVMKTKTHLYEKFGHTFYNITGVEIDYTLQGMKLRLDNLFGGVKGLEETTNQYLNDNWQPVSEALRDIIERSIEDIMMGVLNKIFHYIPADYFVGDIPTPGELYGNKND